MVEGRIDDLLQAVRRAPRDCDLRRELVETLLKANDCSGAARHHEVLSLLLPDEIWVLALEVRIAAAQGDDLRTTRARRRLELVTGRQAPPDVVAAHPSHHRTPSAPEPHRLRLVSDDRDDADL